MARIGEVTLHVKGPRREVDELSLGLHRDLPDRRDYCGQLLLPTTLGGLAEDRSLRTSEELPAAYDGVPDALRPVWDQGPLGSCGPHAMAAAVAWLQLQAAPDGGYEMPSRLFAYWGARRMMGEQYVTQDSGVRMREMLRALRLWGMPPEIWCPYTPFQFAERPAAEAWAAGQEYQALAYVRLDGEDGQIDGGVLDTARRLLFEGASMPILGMAVYRRSFDDAARTGVLTMPGPTDRLLGGHAVALAGWRTDSDDSLQLLIRNSHGASFGEGGYFWMPARYACEYTWDWWALLEAEHLQWPDEQRDGDESPQPENPGFRAETEVAQ